MPNAVFDSLHAAQPVWVVTRDGKKISGVFTGLSVHLEPARQNIPTMAHPDEMFGGYRCEQCGRGAEAGVDLLDPIARVPQDSEPKKSRLPPLAIDLGVRH